MDLRFKRQPDNRSVFMALFNTIVAAQNNGCDYHKIVKEIEKMFHETLKLAKMKLTENEINLILEEPTINGSTVFMCASVFSIVISEECFRRQIRLDYITTDFQTPEFNLCGITEKMLRSNINPFVVNFKGEKEFNVHSINFQQIDTKLLDGFQTAGKSKSTNIYYSITTSACTTSCSNDCVDKMIPFICYLGIKSTKTGTKVGEGAHGSIYKGQWHGKAVAFKHVKMDPITYRRTTGKAAIEANKSIQEYLDQSSLSHQNILEIIHHFRQQVDGYNETIFVLGLCDCNLSQITSDERVRIPQLLHQTANALNFIAVNGKTHGDVKPQNILIRKKSTEEWIVKVADFGLVSSTGGTPLFMAPENLTGRQVEKSDVYSFGITTLFSLVATNLAIQLIYLPITKDIITSKKQIRKLFNIPLLQMIQKMINPIPAQRLNFADISEFLSNEQLLFIDEAFLADQSTDISFIATNSAEQYYFDACERVFRKDRLDDLHGYLFIND